MTLPSIRLLLDALQRPQSLTRLSLPQWDLLIRHGRSADLLARIAVLAQAAGVWDALPVAPQRHLAAALLLAQRQQIELGHEVRAIAEALAPVGVPVVLLKGAAYRLAGLDAAQGRMVSDVDILVPRERLAEVESALMIGGWVSTQRNAYDQRYYRTWMHELPPLRHIRRGSVLDVHHAILPLTNRLRPDPALLLRDAVPAGADPRVRVLSRPDMVLHSAAHLFHEGELDMGLRGLVDLAALLEEFSRDPGFAVALLARARELQLSGPLAMALRYIQAVLELPVPRECLAALPVSDPLHRSGLRLLDACYLRALRPAHASTSDAWTPLARFVLYLRSHALRMPAHLLLPHLLRKLWLAFQPERSR